MILESSVSLPSHCCKPLAAPAQHVQSWNFCDNVESEHGDTDNHGACHYGHIVIKQEKRQQYVHHYIRKRKHGLGAGALSGVLFFCGLLVQCLVQTLPKQPRNEHKKCNKTNDRGASSTRVLFALIIIQFHSELNE